MCVFGDNENSVFAKLAVFWIIFYLVGWEILKKVTYSRKTSLSNTILKSSYLFYLAFQPTQGVRMINENNVFFFNSTDHIYL